MNVFLCMYQFYLLEDIMQQLWVLQVDIKSMRHKSLGTSCLSCLHHPIPGVYADTFLATDILKEISMHSKQIWFPVWRISKSNYVTVSFRSNCTSMSYSSRATIIYRWINRKRIVGNWHLYMAIQNDLKATG